MLMYTRDGTTIVTQQEKVKNETRQQMNNLFQRLFLVRSFLLSREHHYLFAMGCFHFCIGQAKLNQAHFYSIQFLKVRHFPGEIDNKPLPGVLKLLSRYNRLSKQSFVRFLYGAGHLATSSLALLLGDQKSLSGSLRNSLNLIPRWFQWFSRALSSFSHFSWL